MIREQRVLKQGDTLNLGAGTTFGVNENVVFISSNPSLVTVSSSGLVSVIGSPAKKEKVVISSKTLGGIPLGNYLVFVIPANQDKADVFKEATSNNVERFGKIGQTRNIVVDNGQGPHVGITYKSSDPSFASVSSTGVVTFLQDVSLARQVLITAEDAEGNVISSKPLVVLPQSADTSKVGINPVINISIDKNPLPRNMVKVSGGGTPGALNTLITSLTDTIVTGITTHTSGAGFIIEGYNLGNVSNILFGTSSMPVVERTNSFIKVNRPLGAAFSGQITIRVGSLTIYRASSYDSRWPYVFGRVTISFNTGATRTSIEAALQAAGITYYKYSGENYVVASYNPSSNFTTISSALKTHSVVREVIYQSTTSGTPVIQSGTTLQNTISSHAWPISLINTSSLITFLKFGEVANIVTNIGDGANVGVTYSTTNVFVATVNSAGVVTPIASPEEGKVETCNIVVREAQSTAVLAALRFYILPSSASDDLIYEINSGNLVFEPIEDITGPTGGELSLAISGTELTVNFVSPQDADSGVWKLYLSIESTDSTHVLLPRTNIFGQTSPLIYNTAIPGKSYVATLKALNRDGLSRTLTASVAAQNGWNIAPWNTAPYGL